MKFTRLIILSSVLLLSACAGRPQLQISEIDWKTQQLRIKTIEQWTVKGRIGVKTPDQGFTSNMSWQYQDHKQHFRIYGSFGQTHADIIQSENEATLEIPDKEIYRSNDIENLILNVLGYPLPFEHLKYWIRGLPYPGNHSELTFDERGLLQVINYKQWKISYSKYKPFNDFDNLYLPSMIMITDGKAKLRLSLREWRQSSGL